MDALSREESARLALAEALEELAATKAQAAEAIQARRTANASLEEHARWLEWAMAWLRRLHEQHGGQQLAQFINNAEKAGMHKP